jgi:hypothetical protein
LTLQDLIENGVRFWLQPGNHFDGVQDGVRNSRAEILTKRKWTIFQALSIAREMSNPGRGPGLSAARELAQP